jgi:protein-S-isoprenylcysteine O-methyltransferase Ste14
LLNQLVLCFWQDVPGSVKGGRMTVQQWLKVASVLVAILMLAALFWAWRSAVSEQRRAQDVGVRTEALMDQIEDSANRMERNASAP